jgi:hypothetical protein
MTRLILACLVLAGCSGAANSPLTEPSGDSGVIVGEPDARAAPDVLAVPVDAGVDAFVAPPPSIDAGHDTGPAPADAGVDVWQQTCAATGGSICDGECGIWTGSTNCGGCGINCTDAETCVNQKCLPICNPPTELYCGGQCFDPLTDPNNCTSCGNSCGFYTCAEGVCT